MNQLRQAKLELKKSLRKDYYKILGISKDAGESEIKSAYKKMALKYHPGACVRGPIPRPGRGREATRSVLMWREHACLGSNGELGAGHGVAADADKNSSMDLQEGVDSEAKFKEIGEAYSVLSDPEKRAQYDQGVDLQDMGGGGGGGFGALVRWLGRTTPAPASTQGRLTAAPRPRI